MPFWLKGGLVGIDEVETCPAGLGRGKLLANLIRQTCVVGELAWLVNLIRQTWIRPKIILCQVFSAFRFVSGFKPCCQKFQKFKE